MGQRGAGPGASDDRQGVRGNLPAEISSFVGRAGDLARCADLLGRGRLLTLTGAGGAGKTRLALRLAGTLAARFPGGVWWVDLAPLTGPEAVTGEVARTVPLVPAGAGLDTMAEVLGEVGALLVLDNCEHLGAEVPRLVDRLLRGTRAVRSWRPAGECSRSRARSCGGCIRWTYRPHEREKPTCAATTPPGCSSSVPGRLVPT